jgi:hypothetical protein
MALINTTTTGVLGSTFYGDGTGSLTVQQNGVTLGVFGNQPAFSVYRSSSQSISVNTYTKVLFDAKEFDTNNNYDNTTNYRFLPTVAGYYQLNAGVFGSGTSLNSAVIKFYKNGSSYKQGMVVPANGSANDGLVIGSLVYFNGTTDYIEVWVYLGASSGTAFASGSDQTWFNGCLMKAV